MGRRKRKKGSSSSDDDLNQSKLSKHGGASGVQNQSADKVKVSEVLSQANSILYDTDLDESVVECSSPDINLNITQSRTVNRTMSNDRQSDKGSRDDPCMSPSTAEKSPTNADIIKYLNQIEQRINTRFANVDEKLKTLTSLEQKVTNFEQELKKIWLHIGSKDKSNEEKLQKQDERIDTIEYSSGLTHDKLFELEEENAKLKDTVTYLQSQSMRNNLIFCNIEESENEKPVETENKVRKFMVENLKLAEDLVESIRIERAHRMGPPLDKTKCRKIVCKFNLFTDRETVRKQRSNLEGSRYYLHEQFPPDIVSKRRSLVPKMKKAISEGKRAWISYDTLYINGKPVKDTEDKARDK